MGRSSNPPGKSSRRFFIIDLPNADVEASFRLLFFLTGILGHFEFEHDWEDLDLRSLSCKVSRMSSSDSPSIGEAVDESEK